MRHWPQPSHQQERTHWTTSLSVYSQFTCSMCQMVFTSNSHIALLCHSPLKLFLCANSVISAWDFKMKLIYWNMTVISHPGFYISKHAMQECIQSCHFFGQFKEVVVIFVAFRVKCFSFQPPLQQALWQLRQPWKHISISPADMDSFILFCTLMQRRKRVRYSGTRSHHTSLKMWSDPFLSTGDSTLKGSGSGSTMYKDFSAFHYY